MCTQSGRVYTWGGGEGGRRGAEGGGAWALLRASSFGGEKAVQVACGSERFVLVCCCLLLVLGDVCYWRVDYFIMLQSITTYFSSFSPSFLLLLSLL